MCPICNHANTSIIYDDMDAAYKVALFHINKKLTVRRCDECGVVFTDPQLTQDDLKEYYSEDYGSFQIRERKNIFVRFQCMIKKIVLCQYAGYGEKKWWRFFLYPLSIPLMHFPDRIVRGRALDIGCGSGHFLVGLKELGWQAYGIDPSPIAVRVAQSRGLNHIQEGYMETMQFPESFFDAVIMFHVFEHIPNPHLVLEKIRKLLKPDGRLIIGVPHFKGFGSFLYGRHWAGLSFPLHYFHYDRASLMFLLERHGFAVEKIAYANMVSDIFISSPETIRAVSVNYKLEPFIKKITMLANHVCATVDYLMGNCFAQWFRCGSQITVVSRNKK